MTDTCAVVNPLYQKDMNGFWFHGEVGLCESSLLTESLTCCSQCRNFPPADGEFLELSVRYLFASHAMTEPLQSRRRFRPA